MKFVIQINLVHICMPKRLDVVMLMREMTSIVGLARFQ